MDLKTKFIIPAAGYGTRVGSPLSKELLLFNGEPLIKRFIDLAKKNNVLCHVITRKEKVNLINYLEQFAHVQVQIIEPSKEWPDTIIQSKPYWDDKNILILPDTEWSPYSIIEEMITALNDHDLTVGSFTRENYQTWGTFLPQNEFYHLVEKPQFASSDLKAWGVLAFKKEIGENLFKLILESTFDHQIKETNYKYKSFELDFFKDLTR